MSDIAKVGVIGCGLIAQVMHLHYLRELADRFEITALCDVSESLARACAKDYGVAHIFTRWQDLRTGPVDAVLILTSGSHAPIAMAAAEAGKEVHGATDVTGFGLVGHAREMALASKVLKVSLA